MRKVILAAAVALASVPAHAVTSFSQGGMAAPGEGLVTTRSGTVQERFQSSSDPGVCAVPDGTGLTVGGERGNDYELATDSVYHHRLAPGGDLSCYLALGESSPSSYVQLDFALATDARPLTYLGFYWGSIDPWNHISFYNADGPVDFAHGIGADLTGDLVIAGLGITPVAGGPDAYVDFTFNPTDRVTYAIVSVTSYALEIDNLAYTLAPDPNMIVAQVPEPGTPLVLASGLGLFAIGRRARR